MTEFVKGITDIIALPTIVIMLSFPICLIIAKCLSNLIRNRIKKQEEKKK